MAVKKKSKTLPKKKAAKKKAVTKKKVPTTKNKRNAVNPGAGRGQSKQSGLTRADRNRKVNQELLREKIKSTHLIKNIEKTDEKLNKLIDEIRKEAVPEEIGDGKNKTLSTRRAYLALNKIESIRRVLDSRTNLQMKLLNKLLPDMKHVDLGADTSFSSAFSNAMQRVAEVRGVIYKKDEK